MSVSERCLSSAAGDGIHLNHGRKRMQFGLSSVSEASWSVWFGGSTDANTNNWYSVMRSGS